MLRYSLLTAGAVAVLSATAGAALADPVAPAVPALTASSSAAIVHLVFLVNGKKTDSGAELPAAGSAPPAYNKKTIRTAYSKSTQILGGLTFNRSATTIQTTATGHATTATGIAAVGSASVDSFHGTLVSQLGTLLTVTTGKITSQASFTQTKAGVRAVKGGATIGSLTISAPALGINKTFTGTPKPNQVLFHNGDNSVIIFLNRQIKTTVAGKVAALTVDAVDVQVKNFTFAGNTVTGTIVVGPATAR